MKVVLSLLIIIGLAIFSQAQNSVKLEYFIDNDAGYGRNQVVNLPASPDGNFPVVVNVSAVPSGYHFLYTRILDDNGSWSLTSKSRIEVLPIQTQNNIIVGEYFVDADPGVGLASAIAVTPQDSLIMQNFTAQFAGLPPGLHKLYFRYKDNYGNWSLVSRTSADIVLVDSQNNVASGEYYFDKDPGFGNANPITVSPQDSSISQSLILASTGVAPGEHIFYVRYLDANGKWSQTQRRSVELIADPDSGKIVMLEYFYKTDPGFGGANGVQLPAALQDGEFTFYIPLDKIPQASDTLFIRANNISNNNWSLTTWKVETVILPLTLLSFTAEQLNGSVQLKWLTEHEFNTAYFNVQRSTDGIAYTNIAQVYAKGNSVAKSNYGYMDNVSNLHVDKLFYRLQQADKDGKVTYSNIATARLDNKQSDFSIYPNPASKSIHIVLGTDVHPKDATVLITDAGGHTIFKQKMSNLVSEIIDLSSFGKGLYLISIITTGKVQTENLIIR